MPERDNGLSPLEDEFLDWLLTKPRVPASHPEWAEQHGVHERTLYKWKAKPSFQAEWQRRGMRMLSSWESTQLVMEAMLQKAQDGDVRAAQLYIDFYGLSQGADDTLVDYSEMDEEAVEAALAALD
jgi:hypothetical protein